MKTMTPTLISEQDATLIMGCSEQFLCTAVEIGRIHCVHVNGVHFFTLESLLDAKREMLAKHREFVADERDVESASRLESAYF